MVQSSLSPHVNPVVEEEAGYGQIFTVLIRRFPWFLTVFIVCIAIGGLITKRTPPTYKSSMQLLIEPNYQGKKEGKNPESEFADPSIQIDAATQLNVMQSSKLLQKAVSQLKPQYPDMTVDGLKRSLLLTQVKGKEDTVPTKIFKVDYSDKDPNKTQEVLEVVRQVYIDYNKKQQEERLTKGLKVIAEQLNKVGDEVTKAETKLQRFRSSQNLIDPESEAKNIEGALSNIQQERRSTRSQYEEAVARYSTLQKQLQSTPQNALVEARLSQSTRYQGLLNEIQKTELSLAQKRLLFTDSTPEVQKLIEQLKSQKELLQQEQKRTLGGIPEGNQGALLEQGQKSQIDLNLANQLVETQTNIVSLSARDKVLAKKEQDLSTQLKRFPNLLADFGRLQPQIQLGRERLQQLLKAEQELRQEIAKGGYDWQVVEEPQLGAFVGPDLKQNLLLGGVVGLMLGGIAAFAREASDDSVHSTAELEKQIPLPLLGTTPKLPPARPKESMVQLPVGKAEVSGPWTIQVLQSPPRWESLDLIYKNIELFNTVSTLKSLMITSALPDDSKSSLSLGLAMSAARLHKKVLLIDANLRDPSLHKHLNLPNEQGLSTLLGSDSMLPHKIGIQSLGSSYIDILTAGPEPADPANLLSSPRMQQLISAFENHYDLVLIDAPPVLGMVDAVLTGSYCRSVVLVASIGKVTRTQLAQTTTMLSKLNLIGVVANGVSNSNSTYVPYTRQHRFALQQAMEK
ncbi:polysaccharide biosynthesis tyrosine autokinase [Aetokthonos hydrillicola Thurmond2011]|uniref:Polysaccharide biosynthesis tyrosine autokinase n=1 Tax=Aetokthonos hydrillicola Thurmond2011 TaxID=2712845 RepID=A0AAP5ICX0_9CYAN|nr:polysaccharide biosynthesis tyrosine autokinase [Aetokthonos hydrillicola]MBO3461311.1 polysaccharide biosynthesis tyrosine autokinase [Aetokthonos hydrillicola CCALA 1050]MBW4589649.1 polysaccharide biosynthesis tyrosine autokinase [Aetokthonos hydrillicola CCALA 1050]MDR9899146.1 polysaccharide biosynthesis tyrosine autokinase [Aetokthonos hydrillicola Thurmond2011]